MVMSSFRGSGSSLADMSDLEFNNLLSKNNINQNRLRSLGVNLGTNNNETGIGGIGGTGGSSSSSASTGIGGINDITKQAKDLAQFRLGLDFQQMDKSALLREQESANNFGRTTKLTDQTRGWDRTINRDTQDALTRRNTDVINKEKDMQNTGINQENFAARRAIGLASRRLGG